MNYNRVLLLNPPYPASRVKVVFSAGLGYIAEALKKAEIDYEVLDMSLGYGFGDLMKKVRTFKPHLIGLTLMTYQYKNTYAMLTRLKDIRPDLDILVGGAHISLFREKVLKDCPAISFCAVLEGEETIVELCQNVPLSRIKGLIYKDNKQIIYNGDRPFIQDLDNISFPRYEKFELHKSLNKKINAIPVVSSRGCPFECIYCPVHSSMGETFRARSPQNILEEIIYWYHKGYRRFSFADDNFSLIKKRVYDLCHLIKAKNLKNLKLSCDNGIRADNAESDLLKLMKEVGFYRIAFGVEGGNDKIIRSLKKKENIETIKKAIQDACDLGFEVDLFFLVGSPQERPFDLEDSFKIALGYPISTAYFYNLIPFPNTDLFKWIENNGKFLQKPEDYLDKYPILDNDPIFETAEMDRGERKRAMREAFRIMRKTMYRSWAKKLSKLGIFGKFFAFFYATEFTQNVIIRNRYLKILFYKLANRFISFS